MDDLVDRIYEAALVPERWPAVLHRIAEISGTVGGMLLTVTPPVVDEPGKAPPLLMQWTASESLVPMLNRVIADGWLENNTRGARGFAHYHAGFITDHDLFTPQEIETEPQYRYLRGLGLGLCVGFVQPVPTGDALIFDWERRHTDGPVAPEIVAMLDPLRPHLARSSLMASRLGLERARAAADALATLGLAAAVLSPLHRIVAANAPMQALMPETLREHASGRLRLADKSADLLLDDALAQAAKDAAGASDAVLSLPVSAKHERPAMVVHVLPLRRDARDIFDAAASIVIVTPVRRAEVPAANVIQGLFDLTAAEAKVAFAIARGETVKTIAASAGVREDTLRDQLKAVFAKTGVGRQADLVGLLGSVSPRRT